MIACTCPLVEITDWEDVKRGEYRYLRGDPGDCPIHQTPDSLARKALRDTVEEEERRRRSAAQWQARYGDA